MTADNDSGVDSFLHRVGRRLARPLLREGPDRCPFTLSDFATLSRILRPGDIVLVEGHARVSAVIKYLTQSTWSHAAFFVGDALPEAADGTERPRLIEVDLEAGCIAVPLSKYQSHNTRICRPVGLNDADRAALVGYMRDRIGLRYDMRNIFDLLRYYFPTPPLPSRWRRRMLAVGSGDPTRAICSSLIAEAYQSIGYPILPDIRVEGGAGDLARREAYHIRNFALFTPRDFDLSPYFQVVKPTLENGFDYRAFAWAEEDAQGPAG